MWRITSRPESFPAVAGAVAAVAEADGDISASQREWLDELARRHDMMSMPRPARDARLRRARPRSCPSGTQEGRKPGGYWEDSPWPYSWTVEDVAQALPDQDERRCLVRHLVLIALLDARVDEAEIEVVEAFARGLAVSHPAVATLRTFKKGRTRALTRQLFAGSFIASLMRRIWKQDGLSGAWRIARAVARMRDRHKAARYQALGSLPEGTLGRVLHDHCRANGFAFPGERRGTPEILLFHDVGHALTGRGADAVGEVGMAGFEAGFMGDDDAYSIALFGLYAFGVGAPVIPDFETRAGDFEVEAFTSAYAEGETVDEDLRFWDPWPSMERPVSEVRRALGMGKRV